MGKRRTNNSKRNHSRNEQGIEEESAFTINALVQDSIVDVISSIPTHDMVKGYSHLLDLKFPEIEN